MGGQYHNNGIAQHQRAIAFTKNRGRALDVGCGSTGRFIALFLRAGFSAEGLDISHKMVERARTRHPDVTIHHQDICEWTPTKSYDFISAWESTGFCYF